MTIKSRWANPLPRCSLQQWIFGSSREALSDDKVFMHADEPERYFLTMREYRLLSKRIALGLQAAGLKRGDRVLLFSGNSIWFPAVFCGVLMAGGIFTGANPGFVARELAHQLRDSGASFMLAADGSLDTAQEAAQEAGMEPRRVFIFDPEVDAKGANPSPGSGGGRDGARHWTELLHGTAARAETWDWVEPSDPFATTCCLNYSSGTTGVPKGVEISHGAYVANGEGVVFASNLDGEAQEKRKRARGLCFLPLYHAMAQTYFLSIFPRMLTPVYIMPYFDFVKMLEYVPKYRISALTLVPPVVVALAKHPLARQTDFSSVESVGCGAAPLGREAAEECETRLWAKSGLLIRQGWGMTELTCTCMNWDPTTYAGRRSDAVGELMPNCAARLVSLDGKDTPITEPNKPGELWVTAPTMMKGYWRNHAATAATIVIDPDDGSRWLRTGDVAYVESYGPGALFHIVDRLKELIKVKGNQVAPAELESVLLEREDVLDAAVVGVTIKGEELPRAYIVPDPELKPDPKKIAEWFQGKVARYKHLRGGVVFVDNIPKNPSGKILRKLLREKAQTEVGDKTPPSSKLA